MDCGLDLRGAAGVRIGGNPGQQQNFQALREQLRRRFIEKAASKAGQTVEEGVKTWFTDQHGK